MTNKIGHLLEYLLIVFLKIDLSFIMTVYWGIKTHLVLVGLVTMNLK